MLQLFNKIEKEEVYNIIVSNYEFRGDIMRRFTAALIAVLLLFTVNVYGMEMSLY